MEQTKKEEKGGKVMSLMTFSETCEMVGLGQQTIRRMVKEGNFPLPIRVGRRKLGWKQETVYDWMTMQQDRLLEDVKKGSILT